jgi:hypothetical protein
MSPLEFIEKGIREGNWKTVCEGYKRLTGKALSIPMLSVNDSVKNALRKISEIASVATDQLTGTVQSIPIKTSQYETETKTISKKKSGRPKGKGKKTTKKKSTEEDSSLVLDEKKKTIVQREIGGTQLITNEPDPKEVEQNIVKAKKANQNKIKLDRKTTTTHDVKCNECENTFKSDRPKGEIGQKCNKCLIEKKSRFV